MYPIFKRDRENLKAGRKNRSQGNTREISRRDFVGRAGLISLASIVSLAVAGSSVAAVLKPLPQESLEPVQMRILEALVERLIPTDENGPGAVEAGVARYIERELGDFLSFDREAYESGLAAVQAFARRTYQASFVDLPPQQQDEVLQALEGNRASGFRPDSRTFFDKLWRHTLEGMFSDPYYGGNIDFAGWKLIGYPGPKLAVSEEEQALDATVEPLYVSAFGRSDDH